MRLNKRRQPIVSLAFFAILPMLTAAPAAQTSKPTKQATGKPKTGKPKTGASQRRSRPNRQRPRFNTRLPGSSRWQRGRAVVALKVGTIHPVSGPAIKNGVILIQGARIRAIGAADKVRIPRNAKIVEHADGHAYPGLVDAVSTAFLTNGEESRGGTNAGSDLRDALDPYHEPSRKMVRNGITTAHVGNRSGSTWRGLGAIIRPKSIGFDTMRTRKHGGVRMRVASSGHALSRQKGLRNIAKVFDSLEAYTKKFEDHKKAMAKYTKDFKAYLDHFKKTKGKAGAKKSSRPAGRRPGGRRVRRPRTTSKASSKPTPTKKPVPGKTPPAKKPVTKKAATKVPARRIATTGRKLATSSKAKAPKRPKYPKAPRKDPAKEALLKVKKGDLALHVESHQVDEIRAVLGMARDKELPQVILQEATQGVQIPQEIAEAGVPVIVTRVMPPANPRGYWKDLDGSLPGKLHAAGVPVAIASGSLQAAQHLTLKAAYAAGQGLPEAAAVRAITLTPAELLGIDKFVGSLERGKMADILVTSGPLLRSDSRVLHVMANGRTQYRAGAKKSSGAKKAVK